jgi:hypothetical protein
MTLDRASRYGAFFKCTGEKIITTTKTVPDGCKCADGHRFNATYKFCPECSKPCTEITVEKIVRSTFNPMLDTDDLVEIQVKDACYYFVNKDETTWISIDDDGENVFLTVPPLEKFKNALLKHDDYSRFVKMLEGKYNSVKVVTGALIDYN